jgi:hypothetical protein
MACSQKQQVKSKSKKAKKKVDEALKIANHWLPLLNEFALEAGAQPYAHPWVPVEVLREIAKVLDA